MKILRKGESSWVDAKKNMPLNPGDKVLTEENGKAVFTYSDLSVIKMRKNTVCEPIPVKSGISGINMRFGSVFVKVNPEKMKNKNLKFQLESEKAIAGVRGTIFFYEEQLKIGLSIQKAKELLLKNMKVPTEDGRLTVVKGLVDGFNKGNGDIEILNKLETWIISPLKKSYKSKVKDKTIENLKEESDLSEKTIIVPLDKRWGKSNPSEDTSYFKRKSQEETEFVIRTTGAKKSSQKGTDLKTTFMYLASIAILLLVTFFLGSFILELFRPPLQDDRKKDKKSREWPPKTLSDDDFKKK
ncbi:FecR domain-containing protein [Candidatus Riflebacteria bacterium]